MERTGILGGTFNPVHMGHLIVAQSAYDAFDLSRVLFVPCASPPHKEATGLISARHRMAMIEEAIEGDLRFGLCDAEIQRGQVSYSIETVTELSKQNPDAELTFIIGSDMLAELHLWKDVHELLELCEFGILQRPGFDAKTMNTTDLQLEDPWPERLLSSIAKSRRIDISSTDIRHRIAEGMRIRYLVPDAVEMYIAEHGLYGYGA